MSYDAVREHVLASIDEALEAAEQRGSGAWLYGFALHRGRHPAAFEAGPESPYHHLPVFWLVTGAGEAMPLTADMVAALDRGIPRPLLLQGSVHCSLRLARPVVSFEPCGDLLLDLLVLPWGQTSNLRHHSVVTARIEARDVDPQVPLVFTTTARPPGWP